MTKMYQAIQHPETAVRLAFLDGWAEVKLGMPCPKRYGESDNFGAIICKAANIHGRRAASGDPNENYGIPSRKTADA